MKKSWGALMGILLSGAILSPYTAEADCPVASADVDTARIAVAGGSLTEIIYALGEEHRIVGVDSTSNYPVSALTFPQIGYVRNLSAEGLLSLSPTLILGEHDAGPPEVIDQLRALSVVTVVVPEEFTTQGIYAKIRCVAATLGVSQKGETLIASLSEILAAHEGAIATREQPRGIVLLGVGSGSLLAGGKATSGHGLLTIAGAQNLLDHEGWKPISEEAMAASAPDFIVIPQRGVAAAGGLDKLLEHPALRHTPAAKAGRVIVMDGMAMLGFGPRTIETAARLRATLDGRAPEHMTTSVLRGAHTNGR
jgi:iron complex transport system substrate-binding protein